MSRKRVLYTVPTGGHPHPSFMSSLSAIRMSAMSSILVDHRVDDWTCIKAPVQMARSALLTWAINSPQGYDYVIMHDDDVEVAVPPGMSQIDQAVAYMEANPKCGIYGLIYLREKPNLPTVTMYHPDFGVAGEHCQVIGNLPAEPFPVGGIGFGWVMLRVKALEMISANTLGPLVRFPSVKDINGNPVELGEDYDLCDRFNRLGWEVIADPRTATKHHKESGALSYSHDEWELCNLREVTLAHGCQFIVPGGAKAMDLPPGTKMLYRQDIEIGAPEGSKITTINGIDCLDLSDARLKAKKAA